MVIIVSLSKSCQKLKNLKRPEKSTNAISLEEPNFLTSDTKLALIKIYETHNGELLAIVEAIFGDIT